jgi:sulfide:quinone oxidoreductase
MTHRIVVLGAGTGGTLIANRLRRRFTDDHAVITVVDQDDRHVYQPGLLFVPFGLATPDDIVRPRHEQLHDGIQFRRAGVQSVDLTASEVTLADGTLLAYDLLVVATGAQLLPQETEGLTGPGWMERMFTFYSLEGATALHAALARFVEGRIVVNVIDLPIKCPVAPLEFAFLADWYFHERGVRDRIDLTFVTPLDAAFTTPTAADALGGLLVEKHIELVPEFNVGSVDGPEGRIVSYDDRTVPFDLLVTVPLHGGADFVARSPGLGDDLGFIPTDPRTLQSIAAPNVFVLGDAANVPTSKAGSVTHFEGEVLEDNIVHFLAGQALDREYDGHTNCFIETGFHKALLIDFNYETEPLPGRFPGRAGPLPLLRESRINHLGKLMFQPLYWHALLPGRDLPGVTAEMHMTGKHPRPTEAAP